MQAGGQQQQAFVLFLLLRTRPMHATLDGIPREASCPTTNQSIRSIDPIDRINRQDAQATREAAALVRTTEYVTDAAKKLRMMMLLDRDPSSSSGSGSRCSSSVDVVEAKRPPEDPQRANPTQLPNSL